MKLNGILLELRILMQRCSDVGDDVLLSSSNGDDDGGSDNDVGRKDVLVEVDSLLENLLMARQELLGHAMKKDEDDGNKEDDDSDSDNSSDDDDDVDYAELIQQESGGPNKDESNVENSSSSDADADDDNNNINLPTQLQNEYDSLRTSWKIILNKHHSNLALHSGMSVNSSKFQSKAVDLSFWDQVQFATSQSNQGGGGGKGGVVDATKKKKEEEFDDSKLYQQMLKDFISQGSGGSSSGGGGVGKSVDPAQEAATRLKRAMRKKNGVEGGDADLTTLLLTPEGGTSSLPNSTTNSAAAANKANVDRRASKGRILRYTVHPKLVNFTFPVSRPQPMIAEDIWFKSLFGGVGKV